MTSLAATDSITVIEKLNSVIKSDINCYKERKHRHVLKSKENTYKHKCNKVLRRKLKKYKLRQDGREDQDVLDVSKILVSTLVIKSPNNLKNSHLYEVESDLEESKPKNYLFKMVRRKEVVKISERLKNSNTEVNIQESSMHIQLTASQEKKQTNAFKLLMDSRNKSIGSNSPGKEKSNDSTDFAEALERKNIKAKRHLLLQKMAEAKGSLRNKEKEEYQDKIIQRQMEKRAQKLKSMILSDTISIKENGCSHNAMKNVNSVTLEFNNKEVLNNNNSKKTSTLKIVDIFNTIEDPINISPIKKHIPKEDQEFLKKLSPSLKKKESMLCYFKKVDKDSECSINPESDNLIKVKLQPRNKKRGKKKKLSLKRESGEFEEVSSNNIVINNEENKVVKEQITVTATQDKPLDKETSIVVKDLPYINAHIPEPASEGSATLNENVIVVCSEAMGDRQKRKRAFNVNAKVNDPNSAMFYNESRPKRSVKRPVKYIDDACLSSSDEDLHIFTPKKKKHIVSVANDQKSVDLKAVDESIKQKVEKRAEGMMLKQTGLKKKPSKLAPIFTSKQSDSAALEAKQKFLQSGVPDKLKRISQLQKINSTPDNSFPVVVHVQQYDITHESNPMPLNIPLVNETEETCVPTYKNNAFKNLLHLNEPEHANCIDTNPKKSTQMMLQKIKESHPKFPVYRTYRYLRGKGKGEFKDCNYVDVDNSIEIMNDMVDVINDSPERLNWTDKYKALTTNQIIGNFESIKELRKWLITWTQNEINSRTKTKAGSDSSDYYQSDTDSRDSVKTMNNLVILTGPTGCGKTACVYAVASDLAMKVIEVNASSKRTGKIMLQDLQEATQSHKVNRGTGNTDSSQKSQEKYQPDLPKKIKKRGRPKKTVDGEKTKVNVGKAQGLSGTPFSQESTRTDSSLILIDDADIVFDQDDGFTSAIVQLVQCSKRPVILITSSLVCPHLQRFLQNGKILKMSPLLPRMLGTWIDIMCLADSGVCWPGVGAKFLNYFKGDIRKTINYLQFCMPSYVHGNSDEETASQNIELYKTNIDEESSCMSWADNDDSEGKSITSVVTDTVNMETNTIWTDFSRKHLNLNCTYPIQLFNAWWSMHSLLTTPKNESVEKCNDRHKSKKASLELEALANAADALSLSDYISHDNPDSNTDITSQPWYYPEENSVSEKENLDYYHKEYEVTNEICQTIVTSSIAAAQDMLGCNKKMHLSCPGMTLHRQRDKIVSRYKTLTSYLNVSAVLDRRALALDYWPSCRTICRFEKSKNDTNMKRNNRFCHYLKSLSVLCKSDTFDNLCDSLCSNEGTELDINNVNE